METKGQPNWRGHKNARQTYLVTKHNTHHIE